MTVGVSRNGRKYTWKLVYEAMPKGVIMTPMEVWERAKNIQFCYEKTIAICMRNMFKSGQLLKVGHGQYKRHG